jgi:ADP-heptose:LPS heptosyltransferase
VEILILHPGGLGDILLSLPAIRLLRSQFPSAGFTIAANIDHLGPVAHGYAERVISLAALPLHRLYAPGALTDEEALFWKVFDRIVSWTGSGNSEFVRNLKQIHPDACIASWRPGPEEPRHVSRLFIDSLGIGNSTGMPPPAGILLDSRVQKQASQWLAERGGDTRDTLVALHPGAGSAAKRWPLPRFIRLAEELALRGNGKLLLIEGPAETGMAMQIANALPADKTILAESLPLNLLAAVIGRCNMFAGNDSGVAHLAAALGIRSVVLFGPTLPQHWAPLGKNVSVLRNPSGCEACATGPGPHTCLDNISVDEVLGSLGS